MSSHDVNVTLVERIERLEKHNRKLRLFAVAAGLVVAAIAAMGQATPKKTVEANEFLLRGADGKVRGRLSMLAQNIGPQLTLLGENGKQLVNLTVIGNTPSVALVDPNGKERLTLSIQDDSPSVALRNANQKAPQIDLALSPQGWGMLALMDSAGNNRSFLVGDDAGARLSLYDEQGFEATLGMQKLVTPLTGETHITSAASLTMFDKDKNVIWRAP